MNTYISLLRGINVSGQKMIRMPVLQSLYESLGFTCVRTYLQSGNVVFDAAESDEAALIAQIEGQIKTSLGFDVPVMIRAAGDLRRIIDTNPFLTQRAEDPARLHVLFLSDVPSPAAAAKLLRPANELGEWLFGEKEIFMFLPDGVGHSKLTNAFFESKLKVATTARNWNTVNALFKLASE